MGKENRSGLKGLNRKMEGWLEKKTRQVTRAKKNN